MTATPGFILYDDTGGIAVYLFPVPEVPPPPLIFYAVLHFFSSSRFNLLLALLVLLLLQLFCAYDFLYAEQFCFFRFSAGYAASMVLDPGGAVEYAIAINEAVELAKKYEGKEGAAFVNGVLGGIAKSHPETKQAD